MYGYRIVPVNPRGGTGPGLHAPSDVNKVKMLGLELRIVNFEAAEIASLSAR